MFTEQKIIIINQTGKAKPKCQDIYNQLKVEMDKRWRVVTAISAPDGIVVVLERERQPVDHRMLPVV